VVAQLDGRYRLVLGQCRNCEAHTFPAEGACPECNATADFETVEQGTRVEAVVRRIYEQEGIARYGAKFRPLD
jgi:uncharacterized OB-fold protein